ncbi:FAD-dependent oxidoreductase [uncultured Sulfitobacter sp.]|uniref:FAD-dependent oxidoreductase n=1 Tax=uncultured Sulfitobacter sp. TaxID=191468 RepID=UPI0030F87947
MAISNAVVIGGGIGGLATAACLSRRGMAVTLLEQAPAISEVGAGLQISPNGMAVLRAMGLEPQLKARGAVRGQAVVLQDYKDGAQVARLDLMRGQADHPYLFMHRADLIEVLLGAAKRGNVSIELGVQSAVCVPSTLPQVKLADNTIRRAKLIVDATGIHSNTRAALNGASKPRFSGQVAWRAVVPNAFNHPNEAHVTMGPGRHLVSYPIRGGSLVNLVAVEERDDWAPEGWSIADDPANLRKAFQGFGGRAAEMITAVDACTLWGLHLQPVAETWHQGGVALVGDAAHPTLPFLAQGANMALEDAWVLADCVLNTPEDQALRRYQSLRKPRAQRVIAAAAGNADRYHMTPGLKRTAAHTGLRVASKLLPGAMIGAFNWLYHHDVTAK